jgi:hypothetical protein
MGDSATIGGLFTIASITRSYMLRRLFEAIRVSTWWRRNGREISGTLR